MSKLPGYSMRGLRFTVLSALLSTVALAQAPVPEPVTDQETELGKAMYDQLRQKVEIVQSSPLYDSLKPIADSISRVAQSRYNHPFKFYIVHEAQPNAFATPGGNVYVVDSLMYFVKNTEQLGLRRPEEDRSGDLSLLEVLVLLREGDRVTVDGV